MTDRDDLAELKRQDDRQECVCGAGASETTTCVYCGVEICRECGDLNERECNRCYHGETE